MADAQANLNINIETANALANLKALQSQISKTYASLAASGANASKETANMSANLVNSINATGKFSASMSKISTSTEYFTNALEKNKLSMGEYFRFAGGSTKTFGKLFTSEFNTIEKVARERVKSLQTQYISLGRDASGALQGISVRPLRLDMQNLGTQVMMTAQKQQIFNQLITQGSTNMLNFGKNMQWAGRQLMVGFTIPLTILGTTASRVFMDLEEQVVRFRRVYGEFSTSADEADKMAGKLQDLAIEFTKYGAKVRDTLEMAADAAAMGKMGNDLLAQVEQATKLAVLGGVDQQKALETTIALSNTFGTVTEDLAGKISFLNAVENQTVLSIEDLTEAIPKAGPVVQQLGGDVEDLAFFLTAMREGGINASEGANALKSGLASLINPTKQAKDMLAGFGINIDAIVEGNTGDIKGTVIQFAQALDQLDPLNRARAIEQLFGKFQFSRISTLFQNVVAQGNQASRVLQLTSATTEELAILSERELARVEESTSYKFQGAVDRMMTSLAPVGEEFLKALTPIIESATKILNWFNSMGDGAKQFGVIAVAAVGVIAPTFLMLFGLMANGFAMFIKGISKVGGFLTSLSGQSKIAGSGVSYLTQEQLENVAVASSLEQSHSRLVQIFTSEAGSVNSLANAYARAVPALRSFIANGGLNPGGAGGNVPTKKYAKGVTMVPGPKGKGDIVPAMLTPGEAVIPADQTAKYFPLIQGIVADNLPGYVDSNVNLVGMHLKGPMEKTPQLMSMMDNVYSGFSKLSSVVQQGIVVLSDLTAAKSGPLNQAAKGSGLTAEGFAQEWNINEGRGFLDRIGAKGDSPSTYERMTAAGSVIASPEAEQALVDLDKKIGARVAQKIGSLSETEKAAAGWLDRLIEGTTQEIVQEFAQSGNTARQEVAQGLSGRSATPVTIRQVGVQNISNPDTGKAYGSAEAYYNDLLQKDLASLDEKGQVFSTESPGMKIGRTSSRGKLRTTSATRNTFLAPGGSYEGNLPKNRKTNVDVVESIKEKYLLSGKDLGDAMAEGAEDSLQMASPSKRMRDIGENAGNSLADGAKEGTKDIKQTVKSNLAPPTPPELANAQAASKKGFFGKLKDKALLTAAKPLARMAGNELVDENGNVIYSPDQEVKPKKNKAKDIDSDVATDDQGNPLIGRDGKPLTNKQVKQEANRQKRSSRSIKAAGILGTAAMGVGMATQIEGPVGEFAQKLMPAVGGLAAFAPMLMALPAPIAALVAVVGAGVWAYTAYNKKLKEVTENARNLAESLGSGTKALNVFAEFAGTVTATELMNRKRQLGSIDVVIGKSEFGETFFGSEQGKAYAEEVKKGFEEIGQSQTIAKLGAQLSTSVISGILTVEQAAGIATELGRTLGDTSIGIGVLGQLVELIGPGGEDILANPLEVKMRVLDVSAEGIFGKGGTLESLTSAVIDPENAEGLRDFIDALFTAPELQAQLAGELVALAGQRQELLDADQVAFDKRIAALKEEERLLRQEGKEKEAGAKAAEIERETTKFWKQRKTFLEESNALVSSFTGEYEKIAGLQKDIEKFGNINTFEGRGGDMEEVRQFLKEYEEFSGKDFEIDIDTASFNDLRKAFKEVETKDLDKLGEAYEGTFTQIGESIKSQFENSSDLVKKTVGIVVDEINDQETVIDIGVRLDLLAGLQTGSLGVDQVEAFLKNYTTDQSEIAQDQIDQYMKSQRRRTVTEEEARAAVANRNRQMQEAYGSVVSGLGPGSGQQLFSIFDKLEDPKLEAALTKKIALQVDKGEIQDAQTMLDTIAQVASYGENTINVDAVVRTFTQNPKALDDYLGKMSQVDTLLSKYGDDLTAEVVFSQVFKEDGAFASFKSNADYFNSLPPVQQKLFISTFLMQMSLLGTEEGQSQINEWKSKQTGMGGQWAASLSDQEVMAQIALEAAEKVTEMLQAAGVIEESLTPEKPTGSGGGTASSWLDEIVAGYRDFIDLSQDVTQGWDDSLAAIKGFGKGGASAMGGLAGKLRRINVPEGMIEKILGMDPDEWEKRKGELFNLDENGQISSLNDAGKAVVQAMSTKQIGDYINAQKSAKATIGDQIEAYDRLVKAGADASTAYEMVQDSALASAIAATNSTKDIKAAADAAIKAKEKQDELDKLQEQSNREDAIREAVKGLNDEFKAQSKILQKLQKDRKNYTDAQIEAILSNKDLRDLVLKPGIDEGALKKALDNANKQAELELEIKKLTVSGQQEIFQQGLSDAMTAFSAQENAINLQIDAKLKDDNKLVQDIQNQLDAMDFEVGNYQAGLDEISRAEELINERYQERFDALDKISEINDQITASQQQQLDLADALSKGDIAAAARAAQEMKKQQSEDAIAQQRRMIEISQRAEIDSLVSSSGMTRKQLEDKVRQLEDERFYIEQNSLRPAEERIRLGEVEKQNRIDQLTILGRTRSEWEQIQSQVDLAQASGWKFAESMKQALSVLNNLLGGLASKNFIPKLNVTKFNSGGMVKYMAGGGSIFKPSGSDIVPAMLTPGEFVIRKSAVDSFGSGNLNKINNGTYDGNSVYNYNLAVNVKSDANPDQIARTVMSTIKQVEGRRIRGNNL